MHLVVEPTTEMIQKVVLVDSFAPVIPYDKDEESFIVDVYNQN
jgi:hypothetical protein